MFGGFFNKINGLVTTLEVSTPEVFANKIKEISKSIVEIIKSLDRYSPNESEKIILGDISYEWVNEDYIPIGNSAEIGNISTNEIINPRAALVTGIRKLKDEIEKMRRIMEQNENARIIVGAWDSHCLEHDIGLLKLREFPDFLYTFVNRLLNSNFSK